MNDEKKIHWIAKGMTYNKMQAGTPGTLEDIAFVDSGKEMSMGNDDEYFGMPIDGRLAVHYIRNLWDTIKADNLLRMTEQSIDKVNSYRKNNHAFLKGNENNKALTELEKVQQELIDQISQAEKWLLDLLNSSFAISMRKNLVLKTLSQPGCEGLRFYLCMKDKPKENNNTKPGANTSKVQPTPENTHAAPGKILTLVMVGLDIHGQDLNFKYDEALHRDAGANGIAKIENPSVCDEYPAVTKDIYKLKTNAPELKPYVLYKYSRRFEETGETEKKKKR